MDESRFKSQNVLISPVVAQISGGNAPDLVCAALICQTLTVKMGVEGRSSDQSFWLKRGGRLMFYSLTLMRLTGDPQHPT